ncbi:M1 family metallopeptidase [Flavobacteriales bacterium]|nr:M1 family metallopeptidase [Flavobacteriales bacterium]
MKKNKILIFLLTLAFVGQAQEFSRKDSLRGNLTPIRACYDVTFYDLKVMIDEQEKSIERSHNIIHFTALTDFSWFQIDLASNMEVQIIEFEKSQLEFSREFDAVYVYFNREVKKGEQLSIKVWYGGYPRVAVNAPWDGGFSWKKDSNGNPWIGVSCQGLGASVWWPNKDHQSDEPDSMRITCTARYPLKIIANGDLRSDTSIWNQYLESWVNVSEWFVSYPINNYNVTLNIGDYTHFSDSYISLKDTLRMDYYVLHDNLEKAKEHFKQVKPMMKCFENYFGEYPFWNDGYALVETPYLGMEHQSAIAYGNDYLPGYRGNTRFIDGLTFDFIIVHESGHEWWGNSITTNDIADMWVHEGFCTYSEVLYVECMHGYDAMLSYVNNQKRSVSNDKVVIGPYHVNQTGSSGDMYFKGSLMLHTLRNLIEDDELWFDIIKGIANDFKYQTVDGQVIMDYINKKSGKDFTVFFSQYLKSKKIPEFQYKFQKEGKNITLLYRWEAIPEFDMPILINTGSKDFWVYPNSEWKEQNLGSFDKYDFKVRDDLFFIDVKKM